MQRADALRIKANASEQAVQVQATMRGYCAACQKVSDFQVSAGVFFHQNVNLREGLICTNCFLSNRNRLMYLAIAEQLKSHAPALDTAILEQTSPLFRMLQMNFPGMQGSEFISPESESGRVYDRDGVQIKHESITSLSFADGSLSLIAHNDVLEHVYDFKLALKECCRTLKDAGAMIFTMPFFMMLDDNLLRGFPKPDGSLEHLLPPEYHGDPMHPESGAYTFHYFGWEILNNLLDAGFRTAEIGLSYDVYAGHTTSNHPDWNWTMLPVLFRAVK